MKRFSGTIKTAFVNTVAHDVANTAKAAAYSGMLMLFPAILVVTTLLAMVPEGTTLLGEMRIEMEQLFPSDTFDQIQAGVLAGHAHSTGVLLAAIGLSLFASLGVMLSLMEGFRRAYQLQNEGWGFWEHRLRALLLVPIALVPLSLASLIVVFGHQIELWMIDNATHELRHIVIFLWRMARWLIAAVTSATVMATLYHFGTRRTEHWRRVVPGSIAFTAVWFPVTLSFGWYVTRVADYSMFYGSFGAGIASLIWLYITAFSILIGAEYNGVLFLGRQEATSDITDAKTGTSEL